MEYVNSNGQTHGFSEYSFTKIVTTLSIQINSARQFIMGQFYGGTSVDSENRNETWTEDTLAERTLLLLQDCNILSNTDSCSPRFHVARVD